MSMRDQYENLDRYAAYDYKDVSNAYGHGEDDAIDRVLEIIDSHMPLVGNSITNKLVRSSLKSIKREVAALKEE